MIIFDIIDSDRETFDSLCYQNEVDQLYAFGSSISSNFNKSHSDIDLLAIVNSNDPLLKGEYLLSLWDSLENFFNRRVDLVTPESVKNPYLKKEIDSKKRLIYDRKREEVST